MVSLINDQLGNSFAKQLSELRELCRSQLSWPAPDTAFALYVLKQAGESVSYDIPLPAQQAPAFRHAQELAVFGFLSTLRPDVWTPASPHWTEALAQLLQRDLFPLDRQTFVFRPVELLGICLGAAAVSPRSSSCAASLKQVLDRLAAEGNDDGWSRIHYESAAFLLGHSWNKPVSPTVEGLSIDLLALLKWIAICWPQSPIGTRMAKRADELDLALLQECATENPLPADACRTALILTSLKRTCEAHIRSTLAETWQVSRESRDAVAIVEQICRRFPLFARQILERRCDVETPGQNTKQPRPTIEIKDEYDVQDAMHALLRLFFDDVRPEVWAPSYAGSQTRMDFVLKRERIVIETKMTRKGLDQKKVVEQLIVDKEHYRRDPDCRTLVCFVFDPEGRCNNPNALEADVSGHDEHLQTLVIVVRN